MENLLLLLWRIPAKYFGCISEDTSLPNIDIPCESIVWMSRKTSELFLRAISIKFQEKLLLQRPDYRPEEYPRSFWKNMNRNFWKNLCRNYWKNSRKSFWKCPKENFSKDWRLNLRKNSWSCLFIVKIPRMCSVLILLIFIQDNLLFLFHFPFFIFFFFFYFLIFLLLSLYCFFFLILFVYARY